MSNQKSLLKNNSNQRKITINSDFEMEKTSGFQMSNYMAKTQNQIILQIYLSHFFVEIFVFLKFECGGERKIKRVSKSTFGHINEPCSTCIETLITRSFEAVCEFEQNCFSQMNAFLKSNILYTCNDFFFVYDFEQQDT